MEATGTITNELTNEIVRRILSVTKPEKIIIFGSATTGTMTKDSDIDILIVDSEEKHDAQKHFIVSQSLRHLGYPFDILFISDKRFDETKDIIGTIAFPANKYGRFIYEAN